MSKDKGISKSQLYGLRSYRAATFKVLTILFLVSIWFKVGLNPCWHFNDIVLEVVSLFILFVCGITANAKNNFPIFKMRNFEFTKEFTYSITSFFVLLFVFILYKNIVSPEFISYLAELSFHDICSLLVFFFPVSCLLIYLIYLSYKITYKTKREKVFEKYDDKTERSLNRYKVFAIKSIFLLMYISLWIKLGLFGDFKDYDLFIEIYSIITIILMFIVGNKDNKLPALHNFHFKIDRYFFYSVLLPYVLVLLYYIFSSNFRGMIAVLDFRKIISLFVFMSPLFFISSLIFYIGCRYPNFISKSVKNDKNRKIRFNAIVSFLISFIVIVLSFLFAISTVHMESAETVLQLLIVFIPLFVIIYLVIFNSLNEINK